MLDRNLDNVFLVILVMYIPVSFLGKNQLKVIEIKFLGSRTYGDSLRDSVINSLQTQWIQSAVNVFITLHILFTLIILFNPVNQDVEELFRIPQGWNTFI